MKRDWQPGDVAMADGPNCVSFIVVRTGYVDSSYWSAPGDWPSGVSDDELEFRPLVVIDPEAFSDVALLAQQYLIAKNDYMGQSLEFLTTPLQAALREFANPTPPRPEEPLGLGAVVIDDEGRRWVRSDETDDLPWHEPDSGDNDWRNYADIAAVRILSEGVTP